MEQTPQQFLARLVERHGPTGFEAPVVQAWLDYVRPFADEVQTDAYGNAWAVLNPGGDPRIVLTGHADELGLMASHIDDEGFIWVTGLGGYDAKILPGMRVRVYGTGSGTVEAAASRQTEDGGKLPPPLRSISGVIGALPPHMQIVEQGGVELKRYRFGENVYVDIGAKNRAHAEQHVRVGDAMVLDYGFRELRRELVVGRGLDNKIGIWCAAEALRRLSEKRSELKCSVIALATVQEEIGGYGAAMAAYRLNPDAAIAVDVTQSIDHPGTDKKRFGDARLGKGPVIAHGSACHPELVARIERVARRARIELQHEAAARATGTDADNIFLTREGIPSAVVSLPQRYMHSPVEMVNTRDLEDIAALLAEVCLDLQSGERFAVQV
jgi:putative aminopeptidase FrvX